MQYIEDEMLPTYGCFVYEVTCPFIDVRYDLNIAEGCKTGLSFKMGDLVSIDLVQTSKAPNSANGPFLRLSDGRGWLFERKFGERTMRRLSSCDAGLWCFWVDNFPYGCRPRYHPTEGEEHVVRRGTGSIGEKVSYEPLLKIYCDRRVCHPTKDVKFYRVQGTGGWVFDKIMNDDDETNHATTMKEQSNKPQYMLLDENKIKIGCFVFKALHDMDVRCTPDVDDGNITMKRVSEGCLISVDAIRKSPSMNGNGPYLRLSDGSGWLYENIAYKKMMTMVTVDVGLWNLKVLNPKGIPLCSHPLTTVVDSVHHIYAILKFNVVVDCDRRIIVDKSSGAVFYRVKGTKGWIFHMLQEENMKLLLLSCKEGSLLDDGKTVVISLLSAWSPDFVRGIASTVERLKEIAFDDDCKIITFLTSGGTHVNVHWMRRVIGIAPNPAVLGKVQCYLRNCTNADLVNILRNPNAHMTNETTIPRETTGTKNDYDDDNYNVDMEEESRNRLLVLQDRVTMLHDDITKEMKLIKKYDDRWYRQSKSLTMKSSLLPTSSSHCLEDDNSDEPIYIKTETESANYIKKRKSEDLK